MRYSLLSYVKCPACGDAVSCYAVKEVPTPHNRVIAAHAKHAPAAGAAFSAAARFRSRTPIGERLTALAGRAHPERNRDVDVESGLLICGGCGRYFPVVAGIAEMLPDHLREGRRDRALLEGLASSLPGDVRGLLRAPASGAADDAGAHYKLAEIAVPQKVPDRVSFLGPGHLSPFNPGNTEFSFYMVKLFASVLALLDHQQGQVILDSGCGYAWTAEWLTKSGLEVIGVDICRDYLEVGAARMGPSRPHLLVGDVENLPIVDHCADAVIAYESFHHIPDRARAMEGFARVLKDGRPVILAEPGAAHEHAAVSVEAMDRYGTLERGMEIADVRAYVAGLPFAEPEQHYLLQVPAGDLERGVYRPAVWRYALFDGNVFRIRKDSTARTAERDTAATSAAAVRPSDDQAGAATSDAVAATAVYRLFAECEAELKRTRTELLIARDAIDRMQQSMFWRARRLWVRGAALFGSDRGDVT